MASSYGTRFQAKNGSTRGFEMPTITGGAQTDLGGAAGTVDMGKSYGSLRADAFDFSEISANAIAERASTAATKKITDAQVEAQQFASDASLEAAQITADARVDAAGKKASGSAMGSAFSAIGTIAGTAMMFSDSTTKNDIKPIEDALTKLRQLRPVTFHYKEEWNSNPERMHHGFIAQEYKEVVPDATYYDSDSDKLCIDTGDLIGLLVRAVQQLETKVTRLEAANALVGVK